jgi:hypothetical protein
MVAGVCIRLVPSFPLVESRRQQNVDSVFTVEINPRPRPRLILSLPHSHQGEA